MPVHVSDYINVRERAIELDCNIPTGLALLPRNFADAKIKEDLLHESTAPTVRILLRQAGITETALEREGERLHQAGQKDFAEWIGPIIFVSGALLSNNPQAISVALGVISNYLTDWFKGLTSGKNVRLDVVVEAGEEGYKRISYEGPVEGLRDLPQVVREVASDG